MISENKYRPKLPFINDSNSLDKRFYSELLHIIGLSESKEGGKKLIGRNRQGQRHTGTMIEDAMIQLDTLDKLGRLENPTHFGANAQEQLFAIALELSITWINRILFLKLLEAQLITYHKRDKSYSFLNIDKIRNYDDLNSLFFQVLARRHEERNEDVKKAFEKVPYLNSSLFEPTDLEQLTLFVSSLKKDKTVPVFSQTVLKDRQGRKRTGSISGLEYLFAFLDAYDFSSEGSEEIQEESKTLINASVLGLIFEKINGYKDGSFFTPGFITMYMCRETIRKAVVQKFNETKKWKCTSIEELYDKIENRKEANKIVNSIRICDPAVGSGHFLVSALNEMIAVKNDLKILMDLNGRRVKEYQVAVANDELTVTDENGDLFEYNPKNRESQRIQETLFHEKQTITEKCLFGVDINSNSVKICRLRLWIELLKNAYYKNATELETLPNIDINIKCGNSLVSRFPIDADLKQALRKSRHTIDEYRVAVDTYRNAQTKEQKKEMEGLIADIKSDFRSEISQNDPKVKKLRKLSGELLEMTSQWQFFEMSKKEKADWNRKVQQLTKEIQKLEAEMEEIKTGRIFENAFEWRFEFPEVLNNDGDFEGFDVVIGNPPYGLFNKKQNRKVALTTDEMTIELLKNKYPEAAGRIINAARIFLAFSFTISSDNGFQCMIIPYGILTDTTSVNLRKHIFSNHSLLKVDAFPERDNSGRRVFEDAKMSSAILLICKKKSENSFDTGISYDRTINRNRSVFNSGELIQLSPELVQIPLTDTGSYHLLVKIYNKKEVIKFGNLTHCLTGETDMTFGKSALTMNKLDAMLLKGVQLDRFTVKTKKEQISQGEIEFVNLNRLSKIISEKKLADSYQRRIALQGLTGVNELRRLKAAIIDKNIFLANSCNYLLEPANCKLELMICWLNSKLLNFIFKTRSTSSNVNGYEVDNLPFCFSKYDNELTETAESILSKKKNDINSDTIEFENKIDLILYDIFNLTKEEIKIIESA